MEITQNLSITEIENEIRSFSFFKNFPESSLQAFSKILQVQFYGAGECILMQNQENDALYFLREGSLEVLVDGEQVGILETAGEVIGEMSLINRSEANASVRALSDVSVFVVQENQFLSLSQVDQSSFKTLMNHVLTQVLMLRLNKTNERAKRFEATNRELQTAQNDLKELNMTLENEIARRSRELVDKVKKISESHLSLTAQQMNQALLENESTAETQRVRLWSNNISEALDLLKPVIDLSERKGQNHFRRVYLCDGNKKQQTIAKLALGGTGVALEVYSSGDELVAALEFSVPDLILIDADFLESIGTIKLRYPLLPMVLMLGQDIKSYLELLKRFPTQPYFVARNPENRALTIKSLTTTVAKLLNNDFFGLEKYLSWGVHVVERKLTSSEERFAEIDNMKAHFKAFGVRSIFLDQVHTVTEEMLMNAIYDAPMDSSGKSQYNHLHRSEAVQLAEQHAVTLRYGTDGVFLAVSVCDPCGSLSKGILQSYLQKNYAGEETIAAGKGGAGKGLFMIVNGSDFVVFNVKPQKKTEVICFFQLDRNHEELPHPTFHLFF